VILYSKERLPEGQEMTTIRLQASRWKHPRWPHRCPFRRR